jgi:hypothetical protein
VFTAANKLSVIEHLIAAWNAHDVDGVLESFTDDAVIAIVPTLPNTSDVYASKPQIRAFVQASILDFAAKARDYEVLGNTVTWLTVITSTGPWLLGTEPITAMAEAVFHGDKIQLLTIILSEGSVARLVAAWNARHGLR